MPEWRGSYQTLEMLYVQTGQGAKAQETLDLEARISPQKGRSPVAYPEFQKSHILSAEARREFLQEALTLADDME
jgi:hypothetical protein